MEPGDLKNSNDRLLKEPLPASVNVDESCFASRWTCDVLRLIALIVYKMRNAWLMSFIG